MSTETEHARRLPTTRAACDHVMLGRQSTRIARYRSYIKLKFIKNCCSSCKTLAIQGTAVLENTMFWKPDLFPSSGEGRDILCWVPYRELTSHPESHSVTCEIYARKSGTEMWFSPDTLISWASYHSTNVPHWCVFRESCSRTICSCNA
jgi:hypothetical protein